MTSPGMAEVHTRDTDIIYVLEGTATFVTGGTVVSGKTAEPDEIRGTAIANGATRRIARGDVIIVPNGIPHWFQEVTRPFNIGMPELAANFAWGALDGKTLYMTARTGLYRVRLAVAGIRP